MLQQLQKENESIIFKYMNPPTIKYYPQKLNMVSIIQKDLENKLPLPLESNNKEEYSQQKGEKKKKRIKCQNEINYEKKKEEERQRRIALEEKKRKEKMMKKVNLKELAKFYKKNEQELLENIINVNKRLLESLNRDKDKEESIFKKNNINDSLSLNLKQLYIFGTNFSYDEFNENKDKFFIYHKRDKWICFPNSDCIIIDQYNSDFSSGLELKKNQTILKSHTNRSYINSVKISPYGAIIFFKNDDKYIIFYRYDYKKKKFLYISEVLINYNDIINDYIIEKNEIYCIVIYDYYNLLILDFFSKEEIISIKVRYLELNFFRGMIPNNHTDSKTQFCFYSKDSYQIYDMQFLGKIKLIEKPNTLNLQKKISCLDFLPPLGFVATSCLLIAFEDKSVYLINNDINEIIYKYYLDFTVNKIISTPFFINFISNSDIIFYKISNPKNIYIDDIQKQKYKLFDDNNKKVIKHESKILCIDIDLYDSKGSSLICTEKGLLYYDFYPERKKIKLYGFNSEEKYINNCIIINNYYANFNKIKKIFHYIVTSHKGGTIKIYGVPSFEIIYEFNENNVEISYLLGIPEKTSFFIFYKNGKIKCFDIHNCKYTGEVNIQDIIGINEENNLENKKNFIKYAKFYPGGRFCLTIDSIKNNLYVFSIEKISPLLIKSKQIPLIQINELTNIIINKVEPFHTFAITNNNNEIYVYEGNDSSIETFNLEKDELFFQNKDYININNLNLSEYKGIDTSTNYLENIDKINQNECYYGLMYKNIEREKHYILIFNYKYNSLFIRDTKSKNMFDVIQLNIPIYNLMFKNRQDYIIIMNKSCIQKINIGDLTDKKKKFYGIDWLPSLKKNSKINHHKLILSEDEKILVLTNNSCYNIYLDIE